MAAKMKADAEVHSQTLGRVGGTPHKRDKNCRSQTVGGYQENVATDSTK